MFEITVTYFDGTHRETLKADELPEFFQNLDTDNVERIELVAF